MSKQDGSKYKSEQKSGYKGSSPRQGGGFSSGRSSTFRSTFTARPKRVQKEFNPLTFIKKIERLIWRTESAGSMSEMERDIKLFEILKFIKSHDNEIYDQKSKNKLLSYACAYFGLHIYIEPLVRRGADINMKIKEIGFKGTFESRLHFPVQACQTLVVEELLKCNINPNTENTAGFTSLQNLASRPIYWLKIKDVDQLKKTVCLLLQYGANPFLIDKNGKTAIDLMREKGFEEIAQIMEKYKQHRSLKQLCFAYLESNYHQFRKADLEKIAQKINGRIIIGSCAICFEDLNIQDATQLACGHDQFHVQCIEQWKEIKPGKATCPLCRSQLN